MKTLISLKNIGIIFLLISSSLLSIKLLSYVTGINPSPIQESLILVFTLVCSFFICYEQEKRFQNKSFNQKKSSLIGQLDDLKSFNQGLMDQLDDYVGVVDEKGVFKMLNHAFQSDIGAPYHLTDAFDFSIGSIETLMKKDHRKIKLMMKGKYFIRPIKGTTRRLSTDQKINRLIFSFKTINLSEMERKDFFQKSKEVYVMHELSHILNDYTMINHFFKEAARLITEIHQLEYLKIYLHDAKEGFLLKAYHGYGREKKFTTPLLTHSHMGHAFLNKEPIVLQSIEDLFIEDEVAFAFIQEGKNVAYFPMIVQNECHGVVEIIQSKKMSISFMSHLNDVVQMITLSVEKMKLYQDLKETYLKTIDAFVAATEMKVGGIHGHSRRVAQISQMIGQALFLGDDELNLLYIAGLMHDVGKMTISKDHSGSHALLGKQILAKVGISKDVLKGIEHHHTDYDLSNSSDLKIKEQPFFAQILRIANDFDYYKTSQEKNNQKILKEKFIPYVGKKYSPHFIKIFKKIITENDEAIEALYDMTKLGG